MTSYKVTLGHPNVSSLGVFLSPWQMLFFCFTHYWLYSWKGTNSRMDGGDEWVPLDVQRLIDWLPDQKSWTNSLKKYVIKKKTQHVENAHFNNENTKPQWNILVENLKVLKCSIKCNSKNAIQIFFVETTSRQKLFSKSMRLLLPSDELNSKSKSICHQWI